MVAGIDSLWKVHVHAPLHRVSDCINAGIARGIVTQVSVVPLDLHSNNRVHPESSVVRSRILIAVTHGQGIQRLLESLGVTCIPTPARQQPSAAEIIAAIKGSEVREIVILPSDRDTHPVADIAASDMRAMGYRVSVIPSRAITQSLAAIAVHEPSLEFDRDVVSMTRAASATRYGAITRATRDVLTMAGACKSGDYLGLIDGEISVIESELLTASKKLLRRMLAPGAELLTIVTGNELSESEIESFLTWVKSSYPLIDLELVSGEQPLWPFIFGVE
jgi:dihydroxyacetone kinase-like predicted kinase